MKLVDRPRTVSRSVVVRVFDSTFQNVWRLSLRHPACPPAPLCPSSLSSCRSTPTARLTHNSRPANQRLSAEPDRLRWPLCGGLQVVGPNRSHTAARLPQVMAFQFGFSLLRRSTAPFIAKSTGWRNKLSDQQARRNAPNARNAPTATHRSPRNFG